MEPKYGITLCLALAFLGTAQCAITAWTEPTIATASGSAALTNVINEGATTGTTTGVTIAATAGNGNAAYTLVSQTPTSPALAVDSSTGVVTVTSGTVAYSTTTTVFTLVLACQDDDAASVTATGTLSINTVPVIATHDSSVCIADASGENVDLIDLSATDANTGQTITWAIASGNTNSDFTIVASTGLVQVASAKTLAAATTASYTLVVTAADDGAATALTATTTLTATVQTACSGAGTLAFSLLTFLTMLITTRL